MLASADSFRGQGQMVSLLSRYIAKGKLGGTLLLLGERGLGKTTLATVITRALTCEQNKDGSLGLSFCGKCYACRSIASGDQPEFTVIAPRGKQISVEQLEEEHDGLRSALMHPTLLSSRVFLIDDAHYLNERTGNQMLKVLEEAPSGTVFILTSDKPQAMLPTIHSRSQKFSLVPMPTDELAQCIAEDAGADAATADEAARMSGGRYVDAMALAADPDWRRAVKHAAEAITRGDARNAAMELAGYEYALLWGSVLRSIGMTEDEAAKQISKAKTNAEKGLRTRRNETERQALINAYDRATAWMLASGARPAANYMQALSRMKERINQNVDSNLAQAAFGFELQ